MALSADLISQLVKVTNDTTTTSTSATVYGTAKKIGGSWYAQVDGSEVYTPIESTATLNDGDRVAITIANHTATVTGNYSDQSAGYSSLYTDLTGYIDEYNNTYVLDDSYIQLLKSTIKIENSEEYISDSVIVIQDGVVKIQDVNIDALATTVNTNNDTLNLYDDYITIEDSTMYISGVDVTALNTSVETLNSAIVVDESDVIINDVSINALNSAIETLNSVISIEDSTVTIKGSDVVIEGLDLKALDSVVDIINSSFQITDGVITGINAIDGLSYISVEELMADHAVIASLDTDYLTADYAWIGSAFIEALYAETGFIQVVISEDGTYTGTLHAVTFEADSIYANSIVLKGEDGLFYKLNTDGVTVTAEQTEYNALSGTILIAKSVTADKIYVSDLYAFDATIGGFIIDENSIHSTVKASVDNTTPGIYMDNTGQFAVGDSSGYIKFYYDEENDIWKLDISASSIHFGSGTDLEESLSQTIILEERYFLNSTSPTETPSEDDSSWVTSSEYTWLDGFYTWEKIITLYADGTTSVDIFCISGNTGNDGENGEDGEDAVTLIIDSSNGDSFKNTAISTTLTVNIIVGGNYIDSSAKMYAYFGDDAKIVWETRGYGDTDYTTLSADDSRLSDNGFIFTLTTNDVNTKLVCRCYLEIGEEEATYLTDENGNYLIDEDSNYLTI